MIEKYGSGIKRVCDILTKEGIKDPVFEIIGNCFKVTIYCIPKDLEKDLEEMGLSFNQQQILKEMKKNTFISQKELSIKIGITEKNIRNNIAKLKKNGLIKRIGSPKSGHWEVSVLRMTNN